MPSGDLEAGVHIGDFRIERRIGAGGMGIVYQARQLTLDRPVALKVLGPALSRPENVARFRREAQAAARLTHPGIARVYYIGQDEHVCYLAMEYVNGVSLRHVIDCLDETNDVRAFVDLGIASLQRHGSESIAARFDSGEPTRDYDADVTSPGSPCQPPSSTQANRQAAADKSYIRRACDIVREAAQSLAHAHQQGVIHRDLKPENLMLDQAGKVYIIDFGIARFFEDQTLTYTGQLVGTPMYMSPEQVTGRINLDHRSDNYSLGLVLYELLTLAPPIMAPTREAVLRQIVTKPLPPVSWQNWAVSADTEAVVHKAIAKDPDERYSTSAALAEDLQRAIDGKPVTAQAYRYRFDESEIVATRPGGIVFSAFVFFFFGCTLLLFGFYIGVAGPLFQVEDTRAEKVFVELLLWTLAFCALIAMAAVNLTVGWGLLRGRRWARWASAVMAAIWICVVLFTIASIALGLSDVANAEMLLSGIALLGIPTIVFATNVAILVLLFNRSAGRWFRQVYVSRVEYNRLRARRTTVS